jgi:DNA gyrase/topoisomerase IV subunit A
MPRAKTTKKTSRSKNQKTTSEETFNVKGSGLIEKIKELIKEGNVRSIIIKDKKGKEIVQIPLTVGVIGVAVAPVLAAVGAIAALVTECTVTVVREK